MPCFILNKGIILLLHSFLPSDISKSFFDVTRFSSSCKQAISHSTINVNFLVDEYLAEDVSVVEPQEVVQEQCAQEIQ